MNNLQITNYQTLQDLLRANSAIDDCGIGFINSESNEVFISFKELYRKALELLYQLQKKGIGAGNELVFQIDDLQAFVILFWACIFGGIIPVPVTVGGSFEHKLKLFNIWEILKKPYLATDAKILNKLDEFAAENRLIPVYQKMASDVFLMEEINNSSETGNIFPAQPDDTAYIQFTSGTTAEPKGVILTHQNLVATAAAIYNGSRMSADDVLLSWMPLTHDMGLNGCHLVPIWGKYTQYLMPTSLFIRHPALWLKKAGEHGASILSSSNFGLKYLLMKAKAVDAKEWDLSRARLIFNGAEPISAKLCDEFLLRLKKYNLKQNTMFTVYGMAEAGLAVTFPPPGEEYVFVNINPDSIKIGMPIEKTSETEKSFKFIDLGYPVPGCLVRICDARNQVLGENMTGYIQISGCNVTPGYYQNEKADTEIFTADGWLNTGDLGFMSSGRLVFIGRASEVVIIDQKYFFPHLIERIIEDIGEPEFGETVFCGVNNNKNDEMEPLLFISFKRNLHEFIIPAEQLRKLLKIKSGLEVERIIPIKKIPKTTSGKIQRYKLVESYLNGEFTDLIAEIKKIDTGFEALVEKEQEVEVAI